MSGEYVAGRSQYTIECGSLEEVGGRQSDPRMHEESRRGKRRPVHTSRGGGSMKRRHLLWSLYKSDRCCALYTFDAPHTAYVVTRVLYCCFGQRTAFVLNLRT